MDSLNTRIVRNVIPAIPNHEDFFNLLYDRLDMVLRRFDTLDEKFTLFITGFSREKNEYNVSRIEGDAYDFKYLGLERQKELLEFQTGKVDKDLKLEKYWNILKRDEGVGDVAISYMRELEQIDLSVEDVIGKFNNTLTSYFQLTKENIPLYLDVFEDRKKAEYYILKSYFGDLRQYCYLSLPFIQFGEIDGIVHIIYHQKDDEKFQTFNPRNSEKFLIETAKNIMKAFSNEYENALLLWDLAENNRGNLSIADELLSKGFFNPENFDEKGKGLNPILMELGYKEYYMRHLPYFRQRGKISNQIPSIIYNAN